MRNNPHWREGYEAYDQGLPLSSNPHTDDFSDYFYTFWHEGWKAAEEDDNYFEEIS